MAARYTAEARRAALDLDRFTLTSFRFRSMDKIFLSALNGECIVGIWEWERRVKQTVIIDVEMAADIRRAAASDRIEDTIDYKSVAKRLIAFVGDSHYQLVETLAEQIARVVVVEF